MADLGWIGRVISRPPPSAIHHPPSYMFPPASSIPLGPLPPPPCHRCHAPGNQQEERRRFRRMQHQIVDRGIGWRINAELADIARCKAQADRLRSS